jgi:hypothetical protein
MEIRVRVCFFSFAVVHRRNGEAVNVSLCVCRCPLYTRVFSSLPSFGFASDSYTEAGIGGRSDENSYCEVLVGIFELSCFCSFVFFGGVENLITRVFLVSSFVVGVFPLSL